MEATALWVKKLHLFLVKLQWIVNVDLFLIRLNQKPFYNGIDPVSS